MPEQRRSFAELEKDFDWTTGQFRQSGPEQRNVVGDVARGVGMGAIGMAQGAVGLSALAGANLEQGSGNPLSWAYHGLGNVREGMQENQSEAMQRARGNVMDAWQEGESFGSNVRSTLGAVAQNPYFLAGLGGEAVGSIIPIGKAASVLGRVAPRLSTPMRAGIAEGAVIGGLVAGDVSADPETTYRDTLVALPAAAAAGVVGYTGGRLGGRLDPDVFIADMFTRRAAGKAAHKGGKAAAVNTAERGGVFPNTMRRSAGAAVGFGIQTVEEGLQEGIEKYAQNIGRGVEDPFAGVGQAFTIGAMAGGLVGGTMGAVNANPRKLTNPKADPKPDTDAAKADTETAGFVDSKTQQAYRDVAAFFAMQQARLEGGESDTVTAQEFLKQRMAQLGKIKTGLAGLADFFRIAGGAKDSEWTGLFAHLASMTQSNDARVRDSANTVLKIATGLKPGSFSHPKSLKAIESALETAQKRAKMLSTRIEKVGEGASQQTRSLWQAQLADVQIRVQALNATRGTILQMAEADVLARKEAADARKAEREARKAERTVMEQQGLVQPSDPSQIEMNLPVGGEAVVQTVEGTQGLEADPSQQTLLGVVPDAGALEMPLRQLRSNPAQRTAFVAALQQRIVERLSGDHDLSLRQLGDMRNLSDKSMRQLAELLDVPFPRLKEATRGELTRADGAVAGSALDVIQRAVNQAVDRAVGPYKSQYQQMLALLAKDTSLSNTKLIQRTQGPFKKVADLDPRIRKALQDVRQSKDTAAADQLAELFGGDQPSAQDPRLAANEMAPGELAADVVLDQVPDLTDMNEGGPPGPKTEGSDGQTSPADPAPRARLSSEPTVPQMEGGLLQRTISRIIAKWRTVPEIVIIENMMSDLVPQRVRNLLVERSDNAPSAFFYDGKVYINKEMMGSEQDVARALYHEVIGHFGLRGVFGDRLNGELDRIWEARQTDVEVFAERYKLDTRDINQRREATEEFLAAKAEQLYEQGLLTNIINAIKAWWADLTGETLTDAQIIRDFIQPAEAFVAQQNNAGINRDGTVRFKAEDVGQPRQGDNIMAKEPTLNVLQKAVGGFAEVFTKAFDKGSFTFTILNNMARTIPSARALIDAMQKAGSLANQWGQKHNILGGKLQKLRRTERENVVNALVYYSKQEGGMVPEPLANARKLDVPNLDGEPSTWGEPTLTKFAESELNIDSWRWDQLTGREQDAVREVFEDMAALHNDRTMMQLTNFKHYYEMLAERTPDPVGLANEYRQAVATTIKLHNLFAKGAYVPQSRIGDYSVIVRSPRFREVEQLAKDGDKDAIAELAKLKRDGDHFVFVAAKTQADAENIVNQYLADPRFASPDNRGANWTLEPGRQQVDTLTLESMAKLLQDYEADIRKAGMEGTAAHSKLSPAIQQAMRRVLIEQGSQDTEVTSRVYKKNIAGVVGSQVLDNTLEHIRHFGYSIAASSTAAQRSNAIRSMRSEIMQLTGDSQSREAQRMREVLQRIDNPFDNAEGFADTAARHLMGVSSLYYLLSNPSYYILQLTQSWILSGPQMAAEFGPRAWTELGDTFTQLKPLVQNILRGRQELTFEQFPDDLRNLFVTLQARNVLDVGMTHDIGSLSGLKPTLQKPMQWMYFAARSVELLNRTSAAATAYRLRMEQLTKGRPTKDFDKATRERLEKQAIDYAETITRKTHGDYSYMNAGQLFRGPVLRNIMQFKKIGFVVAEMLYENARDGWRSPRLSGDAAALFADTDNSIDISPELINKMVGKGWLTDAELAQVRESITRYISSQQFITELDTRQQRLLEQVMQGELSPDTHVTFEKALIQRKAFGYTIGTSALMSGTLSVPFLTTALAMIAKRMSADDEGEELDATPQSTIMRVMGPEMGSFMLRGVAGSALGVDVTQRIGINFVEQMLGSVYNPRARDPANLVSEVATGLMGPSASLAEDMARAYGYFQQYQTTGSQHDLMKGFATAAPLGIRNFLMGSLMDRQGLMNDSRMTLIPREEFTDWEIARKKIGFNPRKVSEFYDMREHMQQVQFAADQKRLLIKRSYFEATRDGDAARIARVMEQWEQLQDDQKALGIQPSPKSELRQFIQRKRREEMHQRRGLPTTGRNRAMIEQLVQRYGSDILED